MSGANDKLCPSSMKRWMNYQLYKITGEKQNNKQPRKVLDLSIQFPSLSYDERDIRYQTPNNETNDLPMNPCALLGVPTTLYLGTLKTIKYTTPSEIFKLIYDICTSVYNKNNNDDEHEQKYDVSSSSSSTSSSSSSSSSSLSSSSLSEIDRAVLLPSVRKQSRQRSSYNPPPQIVNNALSMKMKNEDPLTYLPSAPLAQDVYATSSYGSSSLMLYQTALKSLTI